MVSQEIYEKTTRHFLSPVAAFLSDETVSEILINGPSEVFVERYGRLQRVEGVAFSGHAALFAAARNIAEFAGKPLVRGVHSLDARLPDGSRVHIILPPCSRIGVCLSIRKFNPAKLALHDLIENGTLSVAAAEFLTLAVQLHRNIVVSGGTGSGKTSLLNALSGEIDPDERIVVIEDSSELQLQQPHTVYLESQAGEIDGVGSVSIRDLFVDSLRMRPDRIVVGEVRRGEALDLVQSMISGHSGAMTTVHASSPIDAATRLETLSLMAGIDLPMHVARTQVASAVQLVVQINRLPDGKRRIVNIAECLGLSDDGKYRFRELFHRSHSEVSRSADSQGNATTERELVATGELVSFRNLVSDYGLLDRIDHCSEIFGLERNRTECPANET
jgi:pilus assembly protein CpaF